MSGIEIDTLLDLDQLFHVVHLPDVHLIVAHHLQMMAKRGTCKTVLMAARHTLKLHPSLKSSHRVYHRPDPFSPYRPAPLPLDVSNLRVTVAQTNNRTARLAHFEDSQDRLAHVYRSRRYTTLQNCCIANVHD